MAENKSGDGKSSPFGDGSGAPTGARASGGRDFTSTPSRPSGGGNDFLKNPGGNAPAGGGRDFTKESRSQQSGTDPTNPDDAAPGGRIPLADAPPSRAQFIGTTAQPGQRKPFKLHGESAPASDVGSAGDDSEY